jgi:uncharacterized protein (DUF58 family)
MNLRTVAWACVAGLAGSAVVHSVALTFATLAASAIAALVVLTRRRLFHAVTFDRSFSRGVVPWGGGLEVVLSVANDKLLPLVWLRIRDRWPAGVVPSGFDLRQVPVLGRQELMQTVSLRWFERLRRRYHVTCVERGVLRFGPVDLQAGDPFGIAGVERDVELVRDVVVLPRVLDVPGFDLALGRPLLEAEATRSLAVDPSALRGVRTYRLQDPVRWINWRATARMGALHTNEFDPASLAAVRILLDMGSRYRAWEAIEPELMEVVCVVGASLAAAFAARAYAVGIASNAAQGQGPGALDLPAAYGALPDVLEAIARLRPFTVRDYGAVLAAELADDARAADCVLVTARLRPAVRRNIARLRAERPTTVVFVGVPEEDELADVDLVVPRDLDWRRVDALPLRA